VSDRLAVVGASAAGVAAATGARRAGFEGQILLITEEVDAPYERPPLSKELFGSAVAEPRELLPPSRLSQLDLTLMSGRRVELLVPQTSSLVLDGGERIDGLTGIVLATGVRPRTLALADGVRGVHTLRSLSDARHLSTALQGADPLVVVGGGFVGLELAAAAAAARRRVTVVEAASGLLEHVGGGALGEWLARAHRLHAVDLRLSRTVDSMVTDAAGSVQAVVLDDGSRLDAEVVVMAIGSTPRDELAVQAGLDVRDGVLVDRHGRTSAPQVFAAGDVARFRRDGGVDERIEHWNVAMAQGAAAGATAAGVDTEWAELPYFWSHQFEQMLQVFGRPSADAEVVERWSTDEAGLWLWSRDGRITAVAGIGCPAEVRAARALVQAGAPLADAV
jgi:3-phenylpropionate/trans-cinnamate dioxygenase ferredoxin reductase subunit